MEITVSRSIVGGKPTGWGILGKEERELMCRSKDITQDGKDATERRR